MRSAGYQVAAYVGGLDIFFHWRRILDFEHNNSQNKDALIILASFQLEDRMENKPKIFLFALSTCGWCKKTKELLELFEVKYDYAYVDLAEKEERQKLNEQLKKVNAACSFPTVVIGNTCVVGFQEEKLRKLLAEWKKK